MREFNGLVSCINGMVPFGAKYNNDIRVVGKVMKFTVDAGYQTFTFSCDSDLSDGDICDNIHEFMDMIKSNV